MKNVLLILFMIPVFSFMIYIARDLSGCAFAIKTKTVQRKPVYNYGNKERERHLHIAK